MMLELRAHLVANLFDGDDGGTVTMKTADMVDNVCAEVAHWMIDACGVDELIQNYYLEPRAGQDHDPSGTD